ncbi:hypothetical protein HB774_30150 (plasmid) [Rhizobium leguminosarum bv. viciae]|nr:hypothetical protein HB774_30150 [Rhizobium leguminosarum bv. viciae]
MPKINHMIIGVQASGKTTFAAALWYLVDSREVDTVLKKGSHNGDYQYLEMIASNWAAGWQVERTPSDTLEPIRINLKKQGNSDEVDLNFLDLSGETFERIFATRAVNSKLEELFRSMDGLLLFVSAVRKKDDLSILDIGLKMPEAMPAETDDAEVYSASDIAQNELNAEFVPGNAPQQIQIVDLLQAVADVPVNAKPKRVVVIISAWDKAPAITPEKWLVDRMPLLHQYLENQSTDVPYRVYGVSAQGGSLPKREKPQTPSEREHLLKVKIPGERIKVVGHGASAHDLTHPIQWLSGFED